MKKSSLFIAAVLLTMSWARGQDCSSMFIPQRDGAQLEYKQYDAGDKVIGSSVQRITGLRQTPNGVEATVNIERMDVGGQTINDMEIQVRCENGIYYLDMSNYFNQQGMQGMQGMDDMEVSIEGGNLELPSNLKAGDVLKGGEMTISIASGGMTIMNMNFTIGDRKVEAVEDVTTPAGTFTCYKVSYVMTMQMMGNMKSKGIDWFAKDVGVVRSESYGNDGNLASYTLLTSLK